MSQVFSEHAAQGEVETRVCGLEEKVERILSGLCEAHQLLDEEDRHSALTVIARNRRRLPGSPLPQRLLEHRRLVKLYAVAGG